MSATGTVAIALRYQLNWGNDQPTIDFLTTVLSTSSIVGLALGNIFGGDFVKDGRRTTLINFNWIGLIATFFTLYLNFWSMCVGRCVFGFSCGVMVSTVPKILDETVPARLLDQGFGCSTNIFLNLSLFIMLLVAMGMPTLPSELSTTNHWYIMYGMQIPLQLLTLFLFLTYYKNDTIVFCIKNGKRDEAMRGIKKLYSQESDQVQ